MNPERDDLDFDLDWLAFSYVAGELTDLEHEAFEQRLDRDQSAREAVAKAVELVETLAAAAAARPARIRLPIGRAAAVLAMAAGLLVGVGLWFRPAIETPAGPPGSPASDSVAQTWSSLRQDAEADRHELLAWLDDSSGDMDTEDEAGADADPGVPPGWLIDAASLPSGSPVASPGF